MFKEFEGPDSRFWTVIGRGLYCSTGSGRGAVADSGFDGGKKIIKIPSKSPPNPN